MKKSLTELLLEKARREVVTNSVLGAAALYELYANDESDTPKGRSELAKLKALLPKVKLLGSSIGFNPGEEVIRRITDGVDKFADADLEVMVDHSSPRALSAPGAALDRNSKTNSAGHTVRSDEFKVPAAFLTEMGYSTSSIAKGRSELIKRIPTDPVLSKLAQPVSNGYKIKDRPRVRKRIREIAEELGLQLGRRANSRSGNSISGSRNPLSSARDSDVGSTVTGEYKGLTHLLGDIGVSSGRRMKAAKFVSDYLTVHAENYLASHSRGTERKQYLKSGETFEALTVIATQGGFLGKSSSKRSARVDTSVPDANQGVSYLSATLLIAQLGVRSGDNTAAVRYLRDQAEESAVLAGNYKRVAAGKQYADRPDVRDEITRILNQGGYLGNSAATVQPLPAGAKKIQGYSPPVQENSGSKFEGVPNGHIPYNSLRIHQLLGEEVPVDFIEANKSAVLHVVPGQGNREFYDPKHQSVLLQAWQGGMGDDYRRQHK